MLNSPQMELLFLSFVLSNKLFCLLTQSLEIFVTQSFFFLEKVLINLGILEEFTNSLSPLLEMAWKIFQNPMRVSKVLFMSFLFIIFWHKGFNSNSTLANLPLSASADRCNQLTWRNSEGDSTERGKLWEFDLRFQNNRAPRNTIDILEIS